MQILAIEFWHSISDIERERVDSKDPLLMVRGYCAQACDLLVPLLLQHINNYNFSDDE